MVLACILSVDGCDLNNFPEITVLPMQRVTIQVVDPYSSAQTLLDIDNQYSKKTGQNGP